MANEGPVGPAHALLSGIRLRSCQAGTWLSTVPPLAFLGRYARLAFGHLLPEEADRIFSGQPSRSFPLRENTPA